MIIRDEPEIEYLSLAGRKHRDKGLPSEDACLAVTKNGVTVLCLADGAGSSQYTNSDKGASSAVRTVCELLVEHFDAFYVDNHEALIRSVLIAAIQSDMVILAQEEGLPDIESFSATLMFTAVKDKRVIYGHIGDGIIVRVSGSGLSPVTLPQNGEDISSTIFVTLPDAQNYLRVIRTTLDDTHAIVMLTDGISDVVFDGTKLLALPVIARLADLCEYPHEERERLLAQAIRKFVIDATPLSDDATIGILCWPNTPKPSPDLLPEDGPIVISERADSIREVQKAILPRVTRAREILATGQGEEGAPHEGNKLQNDTTPVPEKAVDPAASNRSMRIALYISCGAGLILLAINFFLWMKR